MLPARLPAASEYPIIFILSEFSSQVLVLAQYYSRRQPLHQSLNLLVSIPLRDRVVIYILFTATIYTFPFHCVIMRLSIFCLPQQSTRFHSTAWSCGYLYSVYHNNLHVSIPLRDHAVIYILFTTTIYTFPFHCVIMRLSIFCLPQQSTRFHSTAWSCGYLYSVYRNNLRESI